MDKDMKILLIGYGKMGKEVEAIALQRGHEVSGRITAAGSPLSGNDLQACDVAIEFTRPEAAVDNLLMCFKAGLPVVTGTTGWHERAGEVKTACQSMEGSLLYASNFSIGVNILFDINRRLAALMSGQSGYAATIEETHHEQKLDRPSGTAVSLANDILDVHHRYENWALAGTDLAGDTLPVTSHREGNVTGKHNVAYTSDIDRIEIRHEAFNRRGFATGAVLAAEWLQGKKGIFTMRDYMASLTHV